MYLLFRRVIGFCEKNEGSRVLLTLKRSERRRQLSSNCGFELSTNLNKTADAAGKSTAFTNKSTTQRHYYPTQNRATQLINDKIRMGFDNNATVTRVRYFLCHFKTPHVLFTRNYSTLAKGSKVYGLFRSFTTYNPPLTLYLPPWFLLTFMKIYFAQLSRLAQQNEGEKPFR